MNRRVTGRISETTAIEAIWQEQWTSIAPTRRCAYIYALLVLFMILMATYHKPAGPAFPAGNQAQAGHLLELGAVASQLY